MQPPSWKFQSVSCSILSISQFLGTRIQMSHYIFGDYVIKSVASSPSPPLSMVQSPPLFLATYRRLSMFSSVRMLIAHLCSDPTKARLKSCCQALKLSLWTLEEKKETISVDWLKPATMDNHPKMHSPDDAMDDQLSFHNHHTTKEWPQHTRSGHPVKPQQWYVSVLLGSGVVDQIMFWIRTETNLCHLVIILSCCLAMQPL